MNRLNRRGIPAVFRLVSIAGWVLMAGVATDPGRPARAQSDGRIAVAVLPLKCATGTAPEFAALGTSEARTLLSRATWVSLVESDRIDRVLAEITKSHRPDYDRDQALSTGRQVDAKWICTGTLEAFIYQREVQDPNSWTGAARINIEATSVETGEVKALKAPIVQTMIGLTPDEAKKRVADCARTAGQMAGDQLAKWVARECAVIEANEGRLLLDCGSRHGISPKQKFEVTYRVETSSGEAKTKTADITVDQVGEETSGGKFPGRATIRPGDPARLLPSLRSGAGGGLGTFFRGAVLGGLSQNPNVQGAVGDAAPEPYKGPPIVIGKDPTVLSMSGQPAHPMEGTAANMFTEQPFQSTEEWDLHVASPGGLAFNAQGEMFVTDGSKNKLFVYGPDGKLRREVSLEGVDGGGPSGAHGIALDHRGVVYVTDRNGCRVFRVEGDRASLFSAGPGGSEGCLNTLGVAVDAGRFIYLGDWGGRIHKYGADGRWIATWDSIPGDARRASMSVDALALGPDGSLYVADHNGNRVVRLSTEGEVKQVLPLPEEAKTSTFIGFVVDRKGYVWLLPIFAKDVTVLHPDGRTARKGARILPAKVRPAALGLDAQGNLCIRDDEVSRFRKFKVDHAALPF